MSRKNYTQFGKWYGVLSLGFIAFFNNPIPKATGVTLFSILRTFQQEDSRLLLGILVIYLLFILGVTVVVLGILNERLWAKWLAIGIYSLTLVMSLSAILMIVSQTIPISFAWIVIFWLPALLQLLIPLFGIVLMLKQPKISEIQ